MVYKIKGVKTLKKDLKELPKLRDSISYFYVEHAIIDQSDSSIVLHRGEENIPVPVSALTCLMLGPGTKITHAAIKTICENGCMIVWCMWQICIKQKQPYRRPLKQ